LGREKKAFEQVFGVEEEYMNCLSYKTSTKKIMKINSVNFSPCKKLFSERKKEARKFI